MGNKLSGAGKGSRLKDQHELEPSRTSPPPGMEGASSGAWALKSTQAEEAGLGKLTTTKGCVRWVASAAEILGALASQQGVSASTLSQQGCVSQSFTIVPEDVVPAGCQKLLGAQKWQLCWEAAPVTDRSPQALSLFLRCPSLVHDAAWRPLSVCCEFSLDIRRLLPAVEQGPPAAESLAPAGPNGHATPPAPSYSYSSCLHRREWLAHAFSAAEPDWGLRSVLSGLDGGALERLRLDVELQFVGTAAHIQGLERGQLSGRVLRDAPLLLQVSEAPCILAMDNFLTSKECQALKDLAGPYLTRSKVSAGEHTTLRTSSGMFITGELASHPASTLLDDKVQRLADLACQLMGRRRLLLSEATQVVRYKVGGEFYAEHYDNKAGECHKRAATIMVYLSDVEEGGTTDFPRSGGYPASRALEACLAGSNNHPAAPPSSPASVVAWGGQGEEGGDEGGSAVDEERASGKVALPPAGASSPPGLKVVPKQGRVIVFWSRLPNGKEDKASIHAAREVVRGVKWIATRWCTEAK